MRLVWAFLLTTFSIVSFGQDRGGCSGSAGLVITDEFGHVVVNKTAYVGVDDQDTIDWSRIELGLLPGGSFQVEVRASCWGTYATGGCDHINSISWERNGFPIHFPAYAYGDNWTSIEITEPGTYKLVDTYIPGGALGCGMGAVKTPFIHVSVPGYESLDATRPNPIISGDSWYNVYPNPAQNVLQIEVDQYVTCDLEMLNATGQVVHRANSVNSHTCDLSSLSPGIYYLKLTDNSTVAVEKIIKQ